MLQTRLLSLPLFFFFYFLFFFLGHDTANKPYSGIHSRNHLTTIVADHYKAEDVDFQLWGEADSR